MEMYVFSCGSNVQDAIIVTVQFELSHIAFCQDWTKRGGWRVLTTKPTVLPGQPGFPYKSPRSAGEDYADGGFKKTVFYKLAEKEQ